MLVIAQNRQGPAQEGEIRGAEGTSAPFSLPRLPEAPTPRGFPVIATMAPVIGSIALWAVTRSPYVLVFALLGPLVALASVGDSAMHWRRKLRKERLRFAAEVAAADAALARQHELERAGLVAAHRNVRCLMGASVRDPERWRGALDNGLFVVVGAGNRVSEFALESGDSFVHAAAAEEFLAPLRALHESASTLADAPLVVDARLGIGICGASVLAAAIARGVILQLAAALSPADYEIVAPSGAESDWITELPHTIVESGQSSAIVFQSIIRASRSSSWPDVGSASPQAEDSAMVAVARSAESLPRECRTVVRVDGASSAVLIPRPPAAIDGIVSPEFISREQARAFASLLATAAESAGFARGQGSLPGTVTLASLCANAEVHDGPAERLDRRRGSLACTPAQGTTAPLILDLVRDGPHAIIGGTTGSGKSELLLAWVLAMAARHGPNEVTFLLVDFKGGSSFAAVQHLPHTVGLITDLDEHSALRALTSLRAELQYRERALAEAGARSIEQLPTDHPLARLVIVVDEFAAMVQDFPELHELFADIAARGRSLGVHLILCTQRPAGVVRDAVLANCTLRISLRVNNRADSTAVIGTDAAAALPRLPLGRAIVCRPGEEPQPVQVAITCDSDAEETAQRWRQHDGNEVVPRRPWCDPLPSRILLDDLADIAAGERGDGIAFGLADLPQEQRREIAQYDPHRQGSLMVVGGHRSGKSGLLATLLTAASANARGDQDVVLVPADHEGAWDVVTRQLEAVRAGRSAPRLLLLDDLDALLGSFSEEYAHAFADAVSALLREGGRAGTQLVATARRLGSSLQSIAALCDTRLLLRLPNKQEHVLAGGDAADFEAGMQAGGGFWQGNRVQVALAPEVMPRAGSGAAGVESLRCNWEDWPGWIVVAAHPAELAGRLGGGPDPDSRSGKLPAGWEAVRMDVRPAAGLAVAVAARGRVLIADAETWQSQWGLFGTLRATMPLVFAGCGTAEFRALTRLRGLPPPIAAGSDAVWLLTPDGTLERAVPPWTPRESVA